MQIVKNMVLESDIFSHSTLNRIRGREAYATLTGGVVSIVLVFLFVGMFSNMMIDTFSNNIVNSQLSIEYDDDPTYGKLVISPNNSFMFAVGLTGIDLSVSTRYFDIYLTQRTTLKSKSGTTKLKKLIPLQPCTEAHWAGVSDSIIKTYYTLNFNEWLCPPIGQQLLLEGKFTSSTFQYGQIRVGQCTSSNPSFPGTTCRNSSEVVSLLNSLGQFTFNFYYINPVINAGQKEFLRYYLEDKNYFSFDTLTGVSANLFFGEYSITTDSSILPWMEEQDIEGIQTSERAIGQSYRMTAGEDYFKFYLRKGPSKDVHTRSFQKLDQTLSYIGGLFGTLTLLLAFLSVYSKYCYELDLGDRIFKQNNGGSFGSQNFNFVVFIGYLVYNLCSLLGLEPNWITMKKYHQCRSECQRQLDIDLLFKKVAHFEEISKVVMEDYQQEMLLMVPKPTIHEARINRKRFLVKSILYHQLDKKAREVQIEPDIFQHKLKEYLQNHNSDESDHQIDEDKKTLRKIQDDIAEGYKKARHQNDPLSKKIMNKLALREVAEGLVTFFLQSQRIRIDDKQEIIKGETAKSMELEGNQDHSGHSLIHNGRVANLDLQPQQIQLMDLARMLKKATSKMR